MVLLICFYWVSMEQAELQLPNSTHGSKQSKSCLKLFSAADKIDCFLMLLGTVGACIHGAGLPVFLILFGRMIDYLGRLSSDPFEMSSNISQNALYLVYLGLVVMASSWIGIAFWKQTGERQTARLQVKCLESILRQDISFFDTEAKGKNPILYISKDAVLVQDAIGDKIGRSLRYLTQTAAGFVVAFMTVWQLALVTLAIGLLLATTGVAYAAIISKVSEKSEAAYAEAGKVALEVFSNIRTIYSITGETEAISAYSKSLAEALKIEKKRGVAKGIGIGFFYSLLFLAWALLLWYSTVLVRHGNAGGGKAFTTIIIVIFSCLSLGQAVPNLTAIQKGRGAVANMLRMINKSLNGQENTTALSRLKGEIEFSHVSFSYPSQPEPVLNDLSFLVEAGKTITFVGTSGSGKSTIISLVQRFYDPTSGVVKLDGHDIKAIQLRWLRQHIGLVSQEPVMFSTTISRNILYGREDADVDQVIEASRAADAHFFIQSLPFGYYTQIGVGGTELSPSQKMRIAIARALLRNPIILLLDGTASSLDYESERALNKIMSRQTTIVTAHKLDSVRYAERIFFLKGGHVVETGSHLELMARGGEYATLVALQTSEPSSICQVPEIQNKHDEIYTFAELLEREKLQDQMMANSRKDLQLTETNIETESLTFTSTPSFMEMVRLHLPDWPLVVLGSFGAVLAGMEVTLLLLGATRVLTAFYSSEKSRIHPEVQLVCFVFVGVAAATIPIYFLQHYFSILLGERLAARVRLSMFSAILDNEVSWFDMDENNSGALTWGLAVSAPLIRSAFAAKLPTTVQNLAFIVIAIVIAFSLCWRIAAATIATFPLLILASITEQLYLKRFRRDYNNEYSRAVRVAEEAIDNIQTVAAFGSEELISIQFASELYEPKKEACLRGHISGLGYGLSQLSAFCSHAVSFWYGSVIIKHKQSNFGDVVQCLILLIIAALAVAEISSIAAGIRESLRALAPVFAVLKRKTIMSPDDPTADNATVLKGQIEFSGVSFHYPTRPEVTVLRNLNLKVEAGKRVAVVGKTGSGKSTLLNLVMRFYNPVTGAVLIDGMDIRGMNLRALRQRISLVQKESVLFSTTILENIRYGNEHASEVEVVMAAMAANAHEFISTMPEGYNTQVVNNGIALSGSQRKRVAIARAILKDPSIVLLDEMTSESDTASEKLVQTGLNKLMENRTTILVAHRLSSVVNSDCIIAVLQHGYVVESGTHLELIRKPSSVYGQVANLQQTTEIEEQG